MNLIIKAIPLVALLSAAVALPTFGSNIATIESQTSGTAATLDSTAIVTAVGSLGAGTTGDGYTYNNYAIITQDSTGSVELFGHLPSGSTYVPAVGDIVSAAGTYSPFNSIPEIGTLTSLTNVSTGNAVPAPLVVTTAQLATVTPTSFNYLGYYLALDNVLITQQNSSNLVPGSFPTHANGTYTVTDVGGSTPLTMFQYASSYSSAGTLGGTVIPTGPVDIYGIVDYFSSTGTPEFIPFSVVATPEPASLGLLGLGAVALLSRRRRMA